LEEAAEHLMLISNSRIGELETLISRSRFLPCNSRIGELEKDLDECREREYQLEGLTLTLTLTITLTITLSITLTLTIPLTRLGYKGSTLDYCLRMRP